MPGWAVAVTPPQNERKAIGQLSNYGLRYFFPQIKKTVRHRGKRVHRLDPLFPNYIFICLIDAWHEVFNMRGISGLIMSGEHPAIVSSEAIQEIKSRCDRDGIYIPPAKPKFQNGQKVKPKDGPLAGNVGLFVDCSQGREIALFDLLGRMSKVEFKEGDLVAA